MTDSDFMREALALPEVRHRFPRTRAAVRRVVTATFELKGLV